MPTLRELKASFYRIVDERHYRRVRLLAKAQGLIFLCPKCFAANGGSRGTHSVLCWFRNRGVPDSTFPTPGRWTPMGTGLDDLTFVPGDPPCAYSVLLTGGCGWHGFVTNGRAE